MDFKVKSSIQVGDLHIGYCRDADNAYQDWMKYLGGNNKFIRGNHDNPRVCQKQSTYLGDFGYLQEQQLFFISGAWSIDGEGRQENGDWWKDEQLSAAQWVQVINLYAKVKPKYVVSHDVPLSVYDRVADYRPIIKNRTSSSLDVLLSMHKPKQWIHGHHHKDLFYEYQGTEFVCLNQLGFYQNTDIKDFK